MYNIHICMCIYIIIYIYIYSYVYTDYMHCKCSYTTLINVAVKLYIRRVRKGGSLQKAKTPGPSDRCCILFSRLLELWELRLSRALCGRIDLIEDPLFVERQWDFI